MPDPNTPPQADGNGTPKPTDQVDTRSRHMSITVTPQILTPGKMDFKIQMPNDPAEAYVLLTHLQKAVFQAAMQNGLKVTGKIESPLGGLVGPGGLRVGGG